MTDPRFIQLQRNMVAAVTQLHGAADELVNELEGNPLLDADSALGDEARATLTSARAWRSMIESPID